MDAQQRAAEFADLRNARLKNRERFLKWHKAYGHLPEDERIKHVVEQWGIAFIDGRASQYHCSESLLRLGKTVVSHWASLFGNDRMPCQSFIDAMTDQPSLEPTWTT